MGEVKNYSMNIGTVRIKSAELLDVDSMVSCHIAAFPGRFMTEMGPRWLKGLYSYYTEHCDAVSLVAVDASGEVLGFAVGGKPSIRKEFLRRALIRYSYIIFWRSCTSHFIRRRLLVELLKKMRLGSAVSNSAVVTPKVDSVANCGNLLSIAVLPKCQGSGIAGQLIESFRDAGKKNGYDALELYVSNDNPRAIAFYKKHNWYEVSQQESSIRFRLDLAGD